ncbi:MAG TPA: lytic transglycosylase domain-containing protein [Bryobacteraceae bacterium]|nr:lytic transglycosylase domain-containing protein [Bryobacteraceae bacterium]
MTPTKDQITSLIRVSAPQFGLDPELSIKQCAAESSFRADAKSSKGCIGLFQLAPATAKEMGVDADKWQTNVWGGLKYMGWLMRYYDGDRERSYAAYNHGLGNIDKLTARYGCEWKQHLPAETRGYLRKILGIEV